MRTIDDVMQEAAEGLQSEGARTMPQRGWVPPKRFTLSPLLVPAAVAVIVLVVIGVPALFVGTAPTSPVGAASDRSESVATPTTLGDNGDSAATTVVAVDPPGNVGPTVLKVSSLTTADPQSPIWPTDWEMVDQILAVTGFMYDSYPDSIPDAAVHNGRAVIVGGNASRIAGIWYSDDGTWTEATISLPTGMTIGESDGDYRLADGIEHVEAFSGGFVAWEQVQLVVGSDPESAGTLVFVSTDGKDWEAAVYGDPNAQFTDFGEYGDGYMATLSLYDGDSGYQTELLWAEDLWNDTPIGWNFLTQVGDGYAHELVVEGSSVYVLMGNYESDDNGGMNVAKVELG